MVEEEKSKGPAKKESTTKRRSARRSPQYTRADYERWGSRGGETTKRRYGSAEYSARGKKGGEQTKKYGPEFYSRIGKKGAESKKKGK